MMNDLKLDDIEIRIPDKMAEEIASQAESNLSASDDEFNEYIVITVNDYDVW